MSAVHLDASNQKCESDKKKKKEPADKPGSVVGNHSSGTAVTGSLKRPTRKRRGQRHCLPIWSCSRWGLPSRSVLPPARCALTAPFHPYLAGLATRPGGILSVALSVGSRPPGITWHLALWSPDFPPRRKDGAIAWPAPAYIVSHYPAECTKGLTIGADWGQSTFSLMRFFNSRPSVKMYSDPTSRSNYSGTLL